MTVDRRSYLGEFPVETGLAQRRVDGTQCPLRRCLGSHEALIVFARDGVRADEALGTGMICFGELEVGDAAAALGDQTIDLRLEGTWINLEEELTLLDARAVLEGDAI